MNELMRHPDVAQAMAQLLTYASYAVIIIAAGLFFFFFTRNAR